MSIWNKVKDWLFPSYKPIEKPMKTLKDLDFLDTVWVLDINESLLEGWVFDINKKHIIVTVPLKEGQFLDFRFSVTKPLSQTQLKQSNRTLFLNKPCTSEILSFFQHLENTSSM